jgi:hypothetical protein
MVKPLSFRPAGLLVLLPAAVLLEGVAYAESAPAQDAGGYGAMTPAWETQKAERRGGFMVGLSLGAGIASMAGFPNDPKKINRARYYTETGVLPGSFGALWIGGAITDWFVFGVGFTAANLFATGDNKARASGPVFHVEGFPLLSLGAKLREIGVMFNAGIGFASVTPDKSPEAPLVEGAACSLVGGGVFYEGLRLWKLSSGPFLAADYYWSGSVRRPGVFVGFRTSLYTKP